MLDDQEERARNAAQRALALARKHDYSDVAAHLARLGARHAVTEMRLDDAFTLWRSAFATLARLGRTAEALQALYPLATLPLFQGPLPTPKFRPEKRWSMHGGCTRTITNST